jgi:citrate lyase subunit beta/citryl-CoA lyase
MRLLRSYLFAPGNNEDLLSKVFRAGADAVVLDLEDAVPESEKARARACVRAALSTQATALEPAPVAFIRINALDSAHWRLDVDAAIAQGVTGVRVPKAENLESICRLNDALGDRERSLGLPPGSVRVMATIESARGVANLADIARGPRVSGLTFGAADFGADVGADTGDGATSLFARSAMVVASRGRRLAPPVAAVFTRLADDEGLRADTAGQKRLGFFGRSAIHPRQIPIIHEVFDPTAEEAAEARRVIAAFEAAGRQGKGAAKTGGAFVDLAVVRKARSILDLHQRVENGARRGSRA